VQGQVQLPETPKKKKKKKKTGPNMMTGDTASTAILASGSIWMGEEVKPRALFTT
jgi:hypothetical protein